MSLFVICAIGFFVLILLPTIIYLNKNLGFHNRITVNIEQSKKKSSISNNKITIGIVGDSWANSVLMNCLKEQLSVYEDNFEIILSGHPGAKSKEIYKNLYKDNIQLFSSKNIIEEKPNYCVVIAGINDAANHLGKRYYIHHLSLIIKTLLEHDIKPVVVSIPLLDIDLINSHFNIFAKIRNKLFSLITNSNKADTTSLYRDYFYKILYPKISSSIILIKNENLFNFEHDRESLFYDLAHLNQTGNDILAKAIAKSIIEDFALN